MLPPYWQIFMSGHGGDQFLKFQDSEEISADDVAEAINEMHKKQRSPFYINTYIHEHTHMHTHAHALKHTSIRTYIYIRPHIHMRRNTYTGTTMTITTRPITITFATRYNEILFVADTCQAGSLGSTIYSPRVLRSVDSPSGEFPFDMHTYIHTYRHTHTHHLFVLFIAWGAVCLEKTLTLTMSMPRCVV